LPSGGVWKAICTLFRSILDTWSWNHNELERNQWAMLYFLKGALAVYVFLLATVKTQGKWRMCLTAGLIYYGWRGLDRKLCLNAMHNTSILTRNQHTPSCPCLQASFSPNPP
jgi:hypothetical protein